MSRTLLNNTGDWELVNGSQDIRGFKAIDGLGDQIGVVASLIVDTDAEIVSSIVLDSGAEIPAFDITIGDGVVYLAGAIPGAATVPEIPEALVHHRVVRREVVPVTASDAHADDFRAHHAVQQAEAGYDAIEAAYRYGYAAAHDEAHRNRAYPDAEAALRGTYPAGRDFDAEREAVRYGYDRAQNAGR